MSSLPLDEPRDQPDEREGLVDFLEFYRQVIRRKADGLSADDLHRTIAASTLTLGGIIKHLSLVEDCWFVERTLGEDLPEPWANVDWGADYDWDFHSATDDSPEYLLDLHEQACARSREVLEGIVDLGTPLRRPVHGTVHNVRWVLIHMIEEYARHAGHADLLRESIDGAVGD